MNRNHFRFTMIELAALAVVLASSARAQIAGEARIVTLPENIGATTMAAPAVMLSPTISPAFAAAATPAPSFSAPSIEPAPALAAAPMPDPAPIAAAGTPRTSGLSQKLTAMARRVGGLLEGSPIPPKASTPASAK